MRKQCHTRDSLHERFPLQGCHCKAVYIVEAKRDPRSFLSSRKGAANVQSAQLASNENSAVHHSATFPSAVEHFVSINEREDEYWHVDIHRTNLIKPSFRRMVAFSYVSW